MLSRIIAGLGITAVLFVPAASAASASSLTVVQAIEAENKIIEANPEYTSLQHFKVRTVAEAKKAIPKIEGLKTALDDAATAVSQASATTSSQKAGQKDWVTGVRDTAHGISDIGVELQDVVAGNQTAARTMLAKALRLIGSGSLLESKGDKLLGLPTSD